MAENAARWSPPRDRKQLPVSRKPGSLGDYALRRRAADLEGVRLLIQADKIVKYMNEVATGRRLVTRRTLVRLRAGEVLLRKIIPDLSQVDFKGLFAFAPMSVRAEALAKLTGEELEQFIALAEKLKGGSLESPAIEGESSVVPEPATPTSKLIAEPSQEDSEALGAAGPTRGNGEDHG